MITCDLKNNQKFARCKISQIKLTKSLSAKFSSKFLVTFLLALFLLGRGEALLHPYSHQDFTTHKTQHCATCLVTNFSADATAAPDLIFTVATFLLLISLRQFSRVKLSYLLSSRSPRAPPIL
jgi:hypothetical protein